MSKELKQCPACNANGEIVRLDRNCFYPRCVRVEECGFESIGGTTEQEAIDRWNNRPIESELQAEIERLTKANTKLAHDVKQAGAKAMHANISKINKLESEVGRLKEAVKCLVYNHNEVDLGGGDCVVTTCRALEMAREALKGERE